MHRSSVPKIAAVLACLAGPIAAQETISIGAAESEETLGRWTLMRGAEGTCVATVAADRPEGATLIAGIAAAKAYRVLAVEGLGDGSETLALAFSNGFGVQAQTTVALDGAGVSDEVPALVLVRPDPMASHPHVQILGGEPAVVLPADVRRDNPRAVDEAYAWIERRRIQELRSDADSEAVWRALAQSSRVTLSQGGAEALVSLAGSRRALQALAACADG